MIGKSAALLLASFLFIALCPLFGLDRVALSAGQEVVQSMVAQGKKLGSGVCATSEVQGKDDIKLKAWNKIQLQCSVHTMSLGRLAKARQNEMFSICIGAALESCQRAIGVSEPCLDLAACRASLGVP